MVDENREKETNEDNKEMSERINETASEESDDGTNAVEEITADSDVTSTEITDNESDKNEKAEAEQQIETVTEPKKNIIKSVVIAVLVILGILVAVLAISFVSNDLEYKKAVELDSLGQYDEAISIFNRLGNYKDAEVLVVEAEEKRQKKVAEKKISEAQELFDSGDKLGAYQLLVKYDDLEGVPEKLKEYKDNILEEAEKKVYWDDDEMSDYRFALPVDEPEGTRFYIAENKVTNELTINLQYFFWDEGTTYGNGFIPPVHPHTLRFRAGNDQIDIMVNTLTDTEFEIGLLGGWEELVTVEITKDEAVKLAEMFADNEVIKVRAIGATRYYDASFGAYGGLQDIVDYYEILEILG